MPQIVKHDPARRRIDPRLVRSIFFGGVLLMFLGCAFLLAAFADASRRAVGLSAVLVIAGGLCAFLAVQPGKRTLWFFLATFLILSGFFVLLSSLRVLHLSLSEWWPLVSVFAGLALIPAGWHHFGSVKPHYVVPAVLFISLGAALLVFSLNIVGFSFRQFLLRWWHLLFVLAGLILMLVSLGMKFFPDDSGDDE